MKCYERFIQYVKWETTSNPKSGSHPSSPLELDFAKYLKQEMVQVGLTNVILTEQGYLYGELKSNTKKIIPTIGFIAHMDTSPDCSGKNINPIIHPNYDGKIIKLNDKVSIDPAHFPFLKEKIGYTLITSDGNTLLGADDKAGIAEILHMIDYLNKNKIEHGDIKVAFTPDEEIGEGADYFDVELFKADYAYTVDGGEVEIVEYENFNAARAIVTINGVNIHPGSAKNKMINSIRLASEFDSLLPAKERPEYTEKYEGFNHLNEITGNVEKTEMDYIIRNHNKEIFTKQKQDFIKAKDFINTKYGQDFITITITDSYYNMAEALKDKMYIVERALDAIKAIGLIPATLPIRGGTDGARLTFMGLPCPNLGTGGFNFHGRKECIFAEDMESATKILIQIVIDLIKKEA